MKAFLFRRSLSQRANGIALIGPKLSVSLRVDFILRRDHAHKSRSAMTLHP
jgi:hypothetical protein